MNKNALPFIRMHRVRNGWDIRGFRSLSCCNFTDASPDLLETAYPRYGQRTVLTHRRGQRGMERWLKYAV